MEFNRGRLELLDRHYGEHPIDESHGDVPPPGADASQRSDEQPSHSTGHLSNLRIERGNATGRTAPAAPRTARLGGSARFEPSSYRHDEGIQSTHHGSHAWHMDSAPPGDIPIHEITDTQPDASVTHHDSSPPGAGSVDPSRRASTSEVPRVPAEARPGPSQSIRIAGRLGGRITRFDYAQFLCAVRAWGTGQSREVAAREASMRGNTLRTYLDDNGLTNKGEAYLQTLSPTQQSEVRAAIAQRPASGHVGMDSSLGRSLGIIGSSSRTAQPASHPPIAEEAPVERERERSGRCWSADAGASSAAVEEGGIPPSLPAHYREIMSVLPGYERNVPLPDLQKQIDAMGATFQLGTYFSQLGTYHKTGMRFRNQLPLPARDRLNAALRRRASLRQSIPSRYDEIMGGDFLHNLALGMRLQDLTRRGHDFVNQWFRADGSLQPQGQSFRDSLGVVADRARFNAACAQRQTLAAAFKRIGRNGFTTIAKSLAKAGAHGRVKDAAEQAGVDVDDIRLFLTDDGLTPAGDMWVPQIVSRVRTTVQTALGRWIERRRQQGTVQPPESAAPSALLRLNRSPMKEGQPRAGTYRDAKRTRRSSQGENAAQPRARTNPARAEAPATSATPAQTLIDGGFVKASSAFLRPEASIADVAASAGIGEEALCAFLTENGLTDEGSELLRRCNLTTQAAVCWNVQLGLNRRAEARDHAAQPASPMRTASSVQPASPASTEQTSTESPRFSGLPSSQWSGWGYDTSTPVQEGMGPPAYPQPAYPSTPDWEVTGSPGPALSADSSLLGSHFSQWPTDLNTHGEEVMGPPAYPQPAYPSTPSWEVTGSPGPALSADSSLLGSQFSHWPSYPDTPGQDVMGPPGSAQPAYPSTPSWNVTGSPGPALSADSSLLGSHFSQWPTDLNTHGQEVIGPPACPQLAYPSTPSWEVAGSPGPALVQTPPSSARISHSGRPLRGHRVRMSWARQDRHCLPTPIPPSAI